MSISAQLSLEGLCYFVHLGCSEAERATPQEIQVSIILKFAQPPMACESDNLEDTLCYAHLEKEISKVCSSKSFQTVEHLAYLCWRSAKAQCKSEIEITIRVRKLNPPIGRANEGALVEIKGLS